MRWMEQKHGETESGAHSGWCDMNPDTEMRIFGYIDSEPPVPGTFKAEVFRAIEQCEQSGAVPDEVVESLAQSVLNLRRIHNARFN